MPPLHVPIHILGKKEEKGGGGGGGMKKSHVNCLKILYNFEALKFHLLFKWCNDRNGAHKF